MNDLPKPHSASGLDELALKMMTPDKYQQFQETFISLHDMVDVYDEYRQQIKWFYKNTDQMYEFVHRYEQGIRPIFSNIIHLIVNMERDYSPGEGNAIGHELRQLLHC